MMIIDSFSYPFMQYALIAALLASLACGIIGTLVVVNRLVFIGGGIAHTAYGGVGIAFFFGLPVLPITLLFTLASSCILGTMTYKNRTRTDAVIGALWAGGMALGILLLNMSSGYPINLMSYLFGNILTTSIADLWMMLGLVVAILCFSFFFYRDILAFTFEEDYAKTRNVPIKLLYFLLLATIAVTVVILIRIVGLILVVGLLTIPAYLAEIHSLSLKTMMIKACLWCALFCITGLFLSYWLDLSSGGVIIAVAVFVFFGMKIVAAQKKSRHSREGGNPIKG